MIPHFQKLPREEKEQLYIKRKTELNRLSNISTYEFKGFSELPNWTDDELEKYLENTIKEIRTKKIAGWILKGIVAAIIVWGIISLYSLDKDMQKDTLLTMAVLIGGYFGIRLLYEIKDILLDILKVLRSRK